MRSGTGKLKQHFIPFFGKKNQKHIRPSKKLKSVSILARSLKKRVTQLFFINLVEL